MKNLYVKCLLNWLQEELEEKAKKKKEEAEIENKVETDAAEYAKEKSGKERSTDEGDKEKRIEEFQKRIQNWEEARCQFHEHFMSSFFVQKCFKQL